MARKRINVKFLVLGILAVLMLASVATAYKFRKRILYGPPDKLIAQAQQLIAEGEYAKATDKLYDAATVGGANPYLYVMLGDAWDLRAGEDRDNIGKARGFWEGALSNDPRYIPAHERILQRTKDLAELYSGPRFYQPLREVAERFLVVDPDNKEAQYALHMSTIQLKRMGGNVDPSAFEDSVRAMQERFAADPTDNDAMLQIALAKLHLAEEAYRSNDDATMQRLVDEVVGMAEGAVQAQPQNAGMQLNAAQAYAGVARIQQVRRLGAEPWKTRVDEAIVRARELVKPGDDQYREIHAMYAGLLSGEEKYAEAEQVYRDLLKIDPKDQLVKLALAELIGRNPARRAEAVALLSEPPPPAKEQQGLDAVKTQEYEARALISLLEIQLGDYATLTDAAQKQKLLAQIEKDYAKLRTMIGERPNVSMLGGRIQMSKGDVRGAVQTFSAILRSPEPIAPQDRLRTMAMLAEGYVMTGQTGQAKRAYADLLRVMETPEAIERTIPHRMRLVELLLNENSIAEARPHVEIVRKHLPPDDPRGTVLQIWVLNNEDEQAERKKLFDSLPQETRAQVLDKARIASRVMNDDALALKLLEGLRAADASDLEVVGLIADHHMSKNNKEQAERVINEALAKAPDNLQLQMWQKRLAADTPEEAQALQQEAIESITDPFRKELRLFELAINQGKAEQAREHLLAAEKMKPDDRVVIDLMYRFYASQKQFTQAQSYLDRLAKIDPGAAEIERINFAMAKGDGNQALELAQRLTRDRGEFAISYLKLAEVHVGLGRFQDAIAAYRSALERDSRSLDALVGIVASYYRAGQPTEARRYIETARRIYPNHARVREIALEHEMNFGDPEQVIAPRQEQLNNDKENPNSWFALGQTYMAAYRNKSNAGREADAKTHLVKAEETFKQAYAKWPDNEQFAAAVAQVALRNQKFDEGAKALRDLAARPAWKDRYEPNLMLAEYLMAANRDSEAEQIYRKLLDETKDVGLELRLADLIHRQGRLDDALAVLNVNPEHPGVRSKRMELLIRGGRIPEAQKELDAMRAAGNANYTPEQARLNDAILLDLQASIYVAQNKPAEAMDAVNKSLAIEPKYPMALYRRGLLRLNARGDTQGAIEDFSAVRQLAPGMADPRIQLARAHRQNNDPDAGLRELQAAVRDLPADKSIRLELVRFCAQSIPPRWGDAERTFREARDIPTLAKDPDLLQEEARMWATRNDMQRAVRTIQEAAQVAPQDMNVIRTLLDILIQGRQYKDVLAISDRMIKSNPNLWWAYQSRGIARSRMDDKDNALVEFEEGIKVASDSGDEIAVQTVIAHIAQEIGTAAAMRRVEPKAQTSNRWRIVAAQLLRSQADYSGALRYVQQVLADPSVTGRERSNVMHLAGELYCNQSPPDISRAIDTFKQLVEMNPQDIGALNNLAAVMTMPGSPASPQEALQYSQKAYDLMGHTGQTDAAILDTHGSILVKVGRIEEGVALLQSSIDRKPLPDAYFHLGDAYLRQSKPDDAETALRRARDLIAQFERDKQPVDPTLRQRVEEALIRASALKQQTSGAQ